MTNLLKKHPLLFSLGFNALCFIVFFLCFQTRYGTTDDLEMQMVVSGVGVLNEPSANLRWTHIFIGQVLSTLYEFSGAIPWYALYLVLAHYLGMTSILYTILRLNPSRFRLVVYGVLSVLGEGLLLQELQFTSSALVLGIGAWLLMYLGIEQGEDKRVRITQGTATLLLLFSAMMRWHSFVLVTMMVAPLLCYALWMHKKQAKLSLGLIVGTTLLAFGLNSLHYRLQGSDPLWADYHERMGLQIVPDMLDYNVPVYRWSEEHADQIYYNVGWDYEDYELFRTWFFADSALFGTEKMRALQATFQDSSKYDIKHIEDKVDWFFVQTALNDYVYLGFVALLFASLLMQGDALFWLLIICSILEAFGLLSALAILKHLPDRVSFLISFYLIVLAMLFIDYKDQSNRKVKVQALCFFFFLSLSSFKTLVKRSGETTIRKKIFTEDLRDLNPSKDQLYIGGGDFYLMPAITPFTNTQDSLFQNFKIVDFGHLSNTPTYYKQLENFNIKDVHKEAVDNEKIFVIHREWAPFWSWYKRYLEKHKGEKVAFERLHLNPKIKLDIVQVKSITQK